MNNEKYKRNKIIFIILIFALLANFSFAGCNGKKKFTLKIYASISLEESTAILNAFKENMQNSRFGKKVLVSEFAYQNVEWSVNFGTGDAFIFSKGIFEGFAKKDCFLDLSELFSKEEMECIPDDKKIIVDDKVFGFVINHYDIFKRDGVDLKEVEDLYLGIGYGIRDKYDIVHFITEILKS